MPRGHMTPYILPLFRGRLGTDTFPYPTLIPPGILVCSPWTRLIILGASGSENLSLTINVIIFELAQSLRPQYLNVTDRQTDRQTTCYGNTASRGNN